MIERSADEIQAMIYRLDDNIFDHGWDASVDAAMRALEWASGSRTGANVEAYMRRPDASRRREWIARGGDPEDWPDAPDENAEQTE